MRGILLCREYNHKIVHDQTEGGMNIKLKLINWYWWYAHLSSFLPCHECYYFDYFCSDRSLDYLQFFVIHLYRPRFKQDKLALRGTPLVRPPENRGHVTFEKGHVKHRVLWSANISSVPRGKVSHKPHHCYTFVINVFNSPGKDKTLISLRLTYAIWLAWSSLISVLASLSNPPFFGSILWESVPERSNYPTSNWKD